MLVVFIVGNKASVVFFVDILLVGVAEKLLE